MLKLPSSFFANGWHLVLSPQEVLLWLTIQDAYSRGAEARPYAPHFLTAEEVEAIADHLTAASPDAPWGSLVRFMAWTGLRTGEVAGLNIGDVDLLRKTVTVRRTRSIRGGVWAEHTPKSGRSRVVPLMPWVGEDLTNLLAMHPTPNDPKAPLWPGSRPGAAGGSPKSGDQRSGSVDFSRPWEAGTFLRRRFRPAVDALDIGPTRLHDLRHTFASLCASRAVPSAQVADWMGHANDVITRQIYTHLFDADSATHADRLAAGGRPRGPAPAEKVRVTDMRTAR
jgi:integrase